MKTLIVEDDFTSRILLQTILARRGTCHAVSTSQEALTAFLLAADSDEPYALLCVDIMMPDVDGTETVRRIRAIEEVMKIAPARAVKIFMITGVHEPRQVFEAFRSMCDAYLTKPIDLRILIEELERHELVAPLVSR